MPVIFEQNTGRVTSINDSVAAGAISLGGVISDGIPISYTQHKTIITRIGLSVAGNFQFLHTIGNDVFIYVFGDRMGQIVLHGLSFAQACPQERSVTSGREPKHGFELLYEWYSANRLAARKAPVGIIVGTKTAFNGFVTAMTGDVQDPLHRTIQFQLTIATLPTN